MIKHSANDSLLFSMLTKLLNKRVQVNISIPTEIVLGFPNGATGEIRNVNYWTSEGMFNVSYMAVDDNGYRRSKDYRFRTLSPKMLDETFTIKKIDGIFTLIKKPTLELEEEKSIKKNKSPNKQLEMAGQLALSTIQKWMDKGGRVKISVTGINPLVGANGKLASIEKLDDCFIFRAEDDDGWISTVTLDAANVNGLDIRVTTDLQGEKILRVKSRKRVEEQLQILENLLENGQTVLQVSNKNVKEYGAVRQIRAIERLEDEEGKSVIKVLHENWLPGRFGSNEDFDLIDMAGASLISVNVDDDGQWWIEYAK